MFFLETQNFVGVLYTFLPSADKDALIILALLDIIGIPLFSANKRDHFRTPLIYLDLIICILRVNKLANSNFVVASSVWLKYVLECDHTVMMRLFIWVYTRIGKESRSAWNELEVAGKEMLIHN